MPAQLSDTDVDRIMDSGAAIQVMRWSIDDTEFGNDRLLDDEEREDWRGRLTGHQMRRWVRRNYSGGERGFIRDNELDRRAGMGEAEERDVPREDQSKAAKQGQVAGAKKKPSTVNPYNESDKRWAVWLDAYRLARREAGT